MRFAAAETSPGCNVIVQRRVVWQTVLRGEPLMRIVEAEGPVLAEKPAPTAARVKLEATPAITLEGRICWILGPLLMTIEAVPEALGSAALTAFRVIEFGDGASFGAVYSPFGETVPHAVPAQPPLVVSMDHWTPELFVPATDALNC